MEQSVSGVHPAIETSMKPIRLALGRDAIHPAEVLVVRNAEQLDPLLEGVEHLRDVSRGQFLGFGHRTS